jgi:Polyketide cyclase / dehydrase and lipid transport
MPDIRLITGAASPERRTPMITKVTHSLASICALAFLTVGAAPVSAASLSRSVDVNGTPASVWSMIGPFCAIKDWHPVIGTCTEDGKSPPTRTLVSKDGKATFVELQTARNDKTHQYSYTIKSSPLPIANYKSTLKVAAKSKDISTITWTGTYTPDQGKAKAANDALAGIYGTGLDAIKAKLTK